MNDITGLFQNDEDICYKLVEQVANTQIDYEKARDILEPYLKDISYKELKTYYTLTWPWKSNPVKQLKIDE